MFKYPLGSTSLAAVGKDSLERVVVPFVFGLWLKGRGNLDRRLVKPPFALFLACQNQRVGPKLGLHPIKGFFERTGFKFSDVHKAPLTRRR